ECRRKDQSRDRRRRAEGPGGKTREAGAGRSCATGREGRRDARRSQSERWQEDSGYTRRPHHRGRGAGLDAPGPDDAGRLPQAELRHPGGYARSGTKAMPRWCLAIRRLGLSLSGVDPQTVAPEPTLRGTSEPPRATVGQRPTLVIELLAPNYMTAPPELPD